MSWFSSVTGKLGRAIQGGLRPLEKKLGQVGQAVGGVAGGIIAGPRGAQFGAALGKKLGGGLVPHTAPLPNPTRPLAPSGPIYPRMPGMPSGLPNLPTAPRGLMPLAPSKSNTMTMPNLPRGVQVQQQPAQGSYQWFDQNIFKGWLPGGTPPQLGPGGGAAAVGGQIPMVTDPVNVTAPRAPRGYVLVHMPDGSTKAVLKEVAYALGLKKRPQKRGGISSKEIRTARKVQHLITSLTVARHPRTPIRKKARR